MATVADLAEALATATRFPKSEICQRIRALREAGELPTALSKYAVPHVTQRQAAITLIACLAGGPLRDTVKRAREYAALSLPGHPETKLAGMMALELVGAAVSEFDELVLVEEPVASASIWYATTDGDDQITFGPAPGARWTQRHFRRDGLEILARALDS